MKIYRDLYKTNLIVGLENSRSEICIVKIFRLPIIVLCSILNFI